MAIGNKDWELLSVPPLSKGSYLLFAWLFFWINVRKWKFIGTKIGKTIEIWTMFIDLFAILRTKWVVSSEKRPKMRVFCVKNGAPALSFVAGVRGKLYLCRFDSKRRKMDSWRFLKDEKWAWKNEELHFCSSFFHAHFSSSLKTIFRLLWIKRIKSAKIHIISEITKGLPELFHLTRFFMKRWKMDLQWWGSTSLQIENLCH